MNQYQKEKERNEKQAKENKKLNETIQKMKTHFRNGSKNNTNDLLKVSFKYGYLSNFMRRRKAKESEMRKKFYDDGMSIESKNREEMSSEENKTKAKVRQIENLIKSKEDEIKELKFDKIRLEKSLMGIKTKYDEKLRKRKNDLTSLFRNEFNQYQSEFYF